jgi:glutamine cyclotransferase
MKKYIIIILLLAVALVFIWPLFKGKDQKESGKNKPAVFLNGSNLKVAIGSPLIINIEVREDGIETMELMLNDQKIKTWKSPNGKVSYSISPNLLSFGTSNLTLVSTNKDGRQFTESLSVSVNSDIAPKIWTPIIKERLPHSANSFTQGLEFNNDALYESTGQFGQSFLAKVDLKSGKILNQVNLEQQYFGEGITILGDEVFQITWQQNKCFVYNKYDLSKLREYSYSGEGWGLCNDGKSIVMSNGTNQIVFRNPQTFAIEKTLQVYSDQGPEQSLNELEYHEGLIYANIWQSNFIAVIDSKSGKVLARINASDIVKEGKGNGDVLNGIAYNTITKKWYLTGKNWDKLYQVSFNK